MELEFTKWNRLIRAMELGKRIVLHGFVLSGYYSSNLENYLRFCLEFYKRTDILPPIASLLESLLQKAYSENCRNSYFRERGWNPTGQESLAERDAEFFSFWNFSEPFAVRSRLKEEGFFLRTTIHHNNTGVALEVANRAEITSEAEEELTEYLSRAKNYENVSEYYEDYPFDEEGKEIGIALAFLQFKELGLNPSLLRYDTADGEHIFRVEVPFGTGYKSIREKIADDEEVRPFPFPGEREKEGETLTPWKISICNLCGRTVDDRIFFATVPEDVSLKFADLPVKNGVCAWCLSSYI